MSVWSPTAPTGPGTPHPAPADPGRLAPPWSGQRKLFLSLTGVLVVLFVLAWHEIGMGVLPLFTGIGNIFRFLAQTVPPQFDDFSHTADEALITLCMAVVGTALAVVVSVPIGLLAARNTTVHPAVRWVARSVIVACRSVPDLVFAIVFVEALGVGVLPGILALGFHSIGMVGKLYAEAIEQVPPSSSEAVASTGAGRLQNVMTSVVPEVLPSFSSIALYRLDINLRGSVVLGYVGAGGIGFLLNEDMGELQFRRAAAIVLVMFLLIILMEVVSAVIRRTLIGSNSLALPSASLPTGLSGIRRASFGDRLVSRLAPPPDPADTAAFDRERIRPPWTKERARSYLFLAGSAVAVVLSLVVTKLNPIRLVTGFGPIWHTITLYFPPDFTSGRSALLTGTFQSFSVAIVATTVGFALALPIGLLAARNISDRWVYRTTRAFLLVVRAVPELILAIVFVVAVGLGLVAGTFALIVGTVGFLAKLVAEGIEQVPDAPREATLAAGATRVQETVTSVVTPSLPALVGSGLYMLDVNFRSSTVLGLVGGGGLGFLLQQSIQILAYRTTGAIIISTFAVVVVIEIVTNAVRKRLI